MRVDVCESAAGVLGRERESKLDTTRRRLLSSSAALLCWAPHCFRRPSHHTLHVRARTFLIFSKAAFSSSLTFFQVSSANFLASSMLSVTMTLFSQGGGGGGGGGSVVVLVG